MTFIKAVLVSTLIAAVPAFAAEQAAPNDAQIAAIVVAANQVDIDAGKLAQKKTKNKEVKAFAQTMVKDHGGVNKAASDLAKKLKLKPEANPTSKSLTDGGKEARARLSKLNGAEFDKAYIDNEVTYHQAVLDAIDKTLIPNAKNPELAALLNKTRPAVAAHLEHAKQLQASVGKGA
ncbi:MAG: DUF4142 domain-containing protein [Sulfurifustis sp.]